MWSSWYNTDDITIISYTIYILAFRYIRELQRERGEGEREGVGKEREREGPEEGERKIL